MPSHADRLLHCVRRLASHAGPGPDDSELLSRFLSGRDPAAFEALVVRHGPMVLRVCLQVLGNRHDAEDAFQASFLVLARKAARVQPPSALAGWLHGVAYRAAIGARTAARRRRCESLASEITVPDPHPDPLADLTAREALRILEEEVQRLPRAYRLPLVLCCLHGASQEEAARQLGWTTGSVKGRLERGRQRLRRRLLERGLGLGSALALVEVSRAAATAPAKSLVNSTVLAAAAAASGNSAGACFVSAEVKTLARAGLKHLSLAKTKLGLVLLFMAGAVAVGLAALGHQQPAPKPPEARASAQAGLGDDHKKSSKSPEEAPTRLDRYGDPLPDGAAARLGTVRFRHPNDVTGLAYAPDGKTLASSCWDGTVRLWDAASGTQTGCFRREPKPTPEEGFVPFLGVAIPAGGKTLVAVEMDHLIHVWDLTTGKEVHRLEGLTGCGLAVSGDGKMLAVGQQADIATKDVNKATEQVTFWDLTTGKKVRQLGASVRSVKALGFSPDSKVLAAGDDAPIGLFRPGVDSGASTVRLWDSATGRMMLELEGHTGGVTAVAFAPDGRTLVSASHDGTLRFWDAATGKQTRKIEVPDDTIASDWTPESRPRIGQRGDGERGVHYGGVLSIAYSPDGKLLASGSTDRTIRLWDTDSGRELHTLRGHGREVTSLTFSPDGKVLSSGSLDHTIRLWDPVSGKPLQAREGQDGAVDYLAVSPDGRLASAASVYGTLQLWSLPEGRLLHSRRTALGRFHSEPVFAPDESALLAGYNHTVRAWDTETAREVGRFAEMPGPVLYVAPLPGRKALLQTRGGGALVVWDWANGKELRRIEGPKVNLELGVQLSSDGKTLAAADVGSVYLFATDTGKELRRFDVFSPQFALSPDGRVLALKEFKDRQIRFLSVATGAELGAVADQNPGREALHAPFVFSPDGRLLARVHECIDYSPEGRLLPRVHDGIDVWEVLTGKLRRHFRGHDGIIGPLAFTPDGKKLLSGGEDTTILVWDLTRQTDPPPGGLNEDQLKDAWNALGESDAEKADEAICALAARPEESVPFIKRQLPPARTTDEERLKRLIADLDAEEFTVRQQAARELEALGAQAEIAVRRALRKQPGLEVKRRMEALLTKRYGPPPAPDLLRALRAVEALERAGTSEARQLLESLARGAAEARLTQEAQMSLERLSHIRQQ